MTKIISLPNIKSKCCEADVILRIGNQYSIYKYVTCDRKQYIEAVDFDYEINWDNQKN